MKKNCFLLFFNEYASKVMTQVIIDAVTLAPVNE